MQDFSFLDLEFILNTSCHVREFSNITRGQYKFGDMEHVCALGFTSETTCSAYKHLQSFSFPT